MLRCTRRALHELTAETALQVLGLGLHHDISEVKKAYKKLAVELHPDLTGGLGEGERKEREEKFKEVSVAYGYLEEVGRWEGVGRESVGKIEVEVWWDEGVYSEKWKAKQFKRIRFAIAQLKKTNCVQHIPLPFPDVDIALVASWVESELEAHDMYGYTIRAVLNGPFGVPCVSITGLPAHLYEASKAHPPPSPYSLAAAFRKFVIYMRSEV